MDWDPNFLARSPMFEPLRPNAPAFGPGWPSLADWRQAFERRDPPARNAGGQPVRPVAPPARTTALEDKYEARIRLAGELPLRAGNWHDCFNALVWLAFPLAKAALNARHYDALVEQRASGRPNRGPVQDALTLFDEGGVVVASSDDDLLQRVRAFQWKELLWGQRDRLAGRMRFIVFGHALCEKALQPFLGITGRAMLLKTGHDLMSAPVAGLVPELDSMVAKELTDPRRLNATRDLEVLPILGVPGWCPGNEHEAFYDNADYFRPGRRRPEQRES